jgi:hypothetical protein
MKTIEEEFLLYQIEKCDKKRMEYLEVDNNYMADVWGAKLDTYNNIYSLVEDGYKYREIKQKEKEKNNGK